MNSADLNTLDDWWNEGFDDFFAEAGQTTAALIEDDAAREKWAQGWRAAWSYKRSLRNGAPNEQT